MQRPLRVLILGAGIGGLTLAQALRKKGIEFEIFERDADKHERLQGWSIALHSMLDDFFASMPTDMPPFQQVNHLNPLKLDAEIAFYTLDSTVKLGQRDDGSGRFVRANRARFREWLSTNIPIQYNKKAERIEELEQSVKVHFQDGYYAVGDIVVGAEGVHSTTRKHLFPGADHLKSHKTAVISGECELRGQEMAEQLELGHSSYIVDVSHKDITHHLFVGLDKVAPDGRAGYFYYNLMWHDENAGDIDFWTHQAGRNDLWSYVSEVTRELPVHFRRVVDTASEAKIRLPCIRFYTLVLESLPRGRVTLLGDAAHAMTPFRGEGGCHAMQDALNLARTMQQIRDGDVTSVEEALSQYQEEMVRRGGEAASLSGAQFDHKLESNSRVVMGKSLIELPKERIHIDL